MMKQARPPLETDLLIVGAGPAGLAAAVLAGRCGLDVVVLDENAQPGGQYYRQSRLVGTALPADVVGPSQADGRALIGQLDPKRVRVCTGTTVWGTEAEATLLYTQDGHSGRIKAKAVIIATGAHERVLPFPGWTLPGVMTAGAAQTLLKSQAILPGKAVVVAGTGPFLYPVSTQLAAAGAEIRAICEVSRDRLWPLRVRQPYRHMAIYWEAIGYLIAMRRLGLHISMGSTVVEAAGDDVLREVVIADLDDTFHERPETRRRIPVDTLLTSFGFVPNTQLPRLLGCTLRWDAVQRAYFVESNDRLMTSRPGIYIAGEIAGIGGHRVARAEGFCAAASAVTDMGRTIDAVGMSELAAARRVQSAGRQFSAHMLRTFALGAGMLDLIKPDTVVCRCESVPRSQIDYFARVWQGAYRPVKQCTRAGMGRCQGRICGFAVTQLAEQHRIAHADVPLPDPVRLPIKPLMLGDLAGAGGNHCT
jgi:thioredoxin reductase